MKKPTVMQLVIVSLCYTTPGLYCLGTTNPLDDLVQNLVHEANKNSRAVVTDLS